MAAALANHLDLTKSRVLNLLSQSLLRIWQSLFF